MWGNDIAGVQRNAPEDRLLSLKNLQMQQDEVRKEIRRFESSHDFYLSMWKSAPYAIIALIPASVYAYLVKEIYAIGPIVAVLCVFALGMIGCYVQKNLSEKTEAIRIRREQIENQLERRVAKVEAQFMSLNCYFNFSHYSNFIFEERIRLFDHRSSTENIAPKLLEDMKAFDGDLLDLIDEFDKNCQAVLLELVSFYELAKKRLEECDLLIKVQSPQPPDRLPNNIMGVFLVLSGIVISSNDIAPNAGKSEKVSVTPGAGQFIQLLLGTENNANPYPRLLGDQDLRKLAISLEGARVKVLTTQTIIGHIKAVKYVSDKSVI